MIAAIQLGNFHGGMTATPGVQSVALHSDELTPSFLVYIAGRQSQTPLSACVALLAFTVIRSIGGRVG